MAAQVASTNSGFRSFTPTVAPIAAIRSAAARPMPLPAPVTTNTLPRTFMLRSFAVM